MVGARDGGQLAARCFSTSLRALSDPVSKQCQSSLREPAYFLFASFLVPPVCFQRIWKYVFPFLKEGVWYLFSFEVFVPLCFSLSCFFVCFPLSKNGNDPQQGLNNRVGTVWDSIRPSGQHHQQTLKKLKFRRVECTTWKKIGQFEVLPLVANNSQKLRKSWRFASWTEQVSKNCENRC